MDRLGAMQVFVQVVESGSFARAAERLGISTSACSRQISDLESHLGARLLNRTTRKLSLTESGRAYHERALQLLADVEEAEQAASQSTSAPRGTLRLTCSVNFGISHVAPAAADFLARHPQVKFDLSVSDRLVDLVEDGYDMAVRIGQVGSTNLVARKLGEIRALLCASPEYLKRHGEPRVPRDLLQHNCFTYANVPHPGQWRFVDAQGRDQTVQVSGNVHANNGDMLCALAVRGAGIVYEPDFIVGGDLAAGRLVRLLPGYEGVRADIWAVYPSRRHLSAKVRAFVDFLAERFAREAVRPQPAVKQRATPQIAGKIARNMKPSTASDYLVEVDDLHFSYPGRPVLKGLSLKIPRGKVVAILGASGSGKTTLLQMLGRQRRPDSGRILIDGKDLGKLSHYQMQDLRKQMGMMFQAGGLFTDISVYENVAFILRENTGLPEEIIRKMVLMKLNTVGLRGASDLMPGALSGGMSRRVALARAIIHDPMLAMYDEPFAGLDPISLNQIAGLIRQLNDALGTTSIVVTYDVSESLELVDYVYVIADGKLAGEGTPDEMRKSEDPFLKQFLHALPEGPIEFHYPAKPIEQEVGA